jgi:CHAD domain-containing protein
MADGKWIEGLSPSMPAADAAAVTLAARFEVVRHFLPLAVEKPHENPEYIHQLRVGTRRAAAALRIFGEFLPRKHARAARRSLRKLRRAAGAARDWDVFMMGLTHAGALKGPTGRAALDFLAGYAMGERSAAQVELVQAAAKEGPDFVEESLALPGRVQHGSDPVAARFGDLAATQFGELLRAFNDAATAKSTDPAQMHRLRILGKRLRYALEVFAGCFPLEFKDAVYPRLERLQEILGGVQDAAVGVEQLQSLRDRLKKSGSLLFPRIGKGLEAYLRAVRSKLPASRKAFQTWLKDWTKVNRDLKLGAAVATVAT